MKQIGIRLVLAAGALMLLQTHLPAQVRGDDAQMRAAREEAEIVLDLGRLLGFVYRMTTEREELRLSDAQAVRLLEVVDQIRAESRLDGEKAGRYMARIEDDILTASQLIHTDRLWITSERSRSNEAAGSATQQQRGGRNNSAATGSGASATAEGAAGDLATFAAGGAYNPLIDEDRHQGRDVAALHAYLRERTGRR